jgi:hypothetical protein
MGPRGEGRWVEDHIVSSWRSPGNVTNEVPAYGHKTDFRYFIFILGCVRNDQKCLQIGTFLDHGPDTALNLCRISRSRIWGCSLLEFYLTFRPRFTNSHPTREHITAHITGTLPARATKLAQIAKSAKTAKIYTPTGCSEGLGV